MIQTPTITSKGWPGWKGMEYKWQFCFKYHSPEKSFGFKQTSKGFGKIYCFAIFETVSLMMIFKKNF